MVHRTFQNTIRLYNLVRNLSRLLLDYSKIDMKKIKCCNYQFICKILHQFQKLMIEALLKLKNKNETEIKNQCVVYITSIYNNMFNKLIK